MSSSATEIHRPCGCIAQVERVYAGVQIITSFDPGPKCFKAGIPSIPAVREHFGLVKVKW